ncbi:hypothetical protein ACIQI8_17330 [Streptomyces sp. NPDC092369]|uniref:hypothetical protein n=1 Tax=Streptomyces sp. NPDC092369 TaxID=3366015 RepID=UPI0037F31890
MITHSDDGPDFDPEDELTVLLRPSTEYLGPPTGRYEAIRRGAARRKLAKAAVGAALTCGVAALVVLPLRLTATDSPSVPTLPQAPPPASSPSTGPSTGHDRTEAPTPTAPNPVTPVPSRRIPSSVPSSVPPGQRSTVSSSKAPSTAPTDARDTSSVAPSSARTAAEPRG